GPRWATWSAAIPEPDRPCGERHRVVLTRGLACLLRMRLVRPSYPFLTTYGPTTTFAVVRDLVSPELFACAADAARACGGHSENVLRKALNVLTAIVIHTGGSLNEVTTGDLLAFQSATAPSRGRTRDGSHLAWQMMVDLGVFPPHSTLHAAMRTGPQSTAELVDRHGIADRQIRELLIRYLDERRPALDYSTFRMLVGRLAGAFWADLERHHPGIDTLNLPREVTDPWKERLRFPQNGGSRPTRQRHIDTLITVRAFYLDIAEWALSDPSWAPWAFPSPVRKSDTAGVVKQRRATTASNSATADAPTAPPASTNTPASAAPCSASTPANAPASNRSSATSANASRKPKPTAGRAKSRASRPASKPHSASSPAWTAQPATPPNQHHSECHQSHPKFQDQNPDKRVPGISRELGGCSWPRTGVWWCRCGSSG
ncbi:hypothetical protein AAY23_111819, partial [Frankia casuarinae]